MELADDEIRQPVRTTRSGTLLRFPWSRRECTLLSSEEPVSYRGMISSAMPALGPDRSVLASSGLQISKEPKRRKEGATRLTTVHRSAAGGGRAASAATQEARGHGTEHDSAASEVHRTYLIARVLGVPEHPRVRGDAGSRPGGRDAKVVQELRAQELTNRGSKHLLREGSEGSGHRPRCSREDHNPRVALPGWTKKGPRHPLALRPSPILE